MDEYCSEVPGGVMDVIHPFHDLFMLQLYFWSTFNWLCHTNFLQVAVGSSLFYLVEPAKNLCQLVKIRKCGTPERNEARSQSWEGSYTATIKLTVKYRNKYPHNTPGDCKEENKVSITKSCERRRGLNYTCFLQPWHPLYRCRFGLGLYNFKNNN